MRTVVSVVAVTVVLLLLLLPIGERGYAWLVACRGEERAVFEEFPQYDPRTPQELDPRPDLNAFTAAGGACVVHYRTPDGASEVLDYFARRLGENGWEVRPSNSAALYARRGGYEYRVSFSGDPTNKQKGTPVAVVVREP